MKKLILSLVIFSLLSCSNNDDSNNNLQNETISYKSWDDFMYSYTKLSKNLSENSERVKQKIKKDESLSILSPALNEILNNENEIIINNNIFWFFDGKFYNLGNNRDLKKKFPNIEVSNEIIISKKEFVSNSTDDSSELNNRFNLNHGSIDARYQKEFYRQSYYDCISSTNYGPTSRKVKFVHEIYNESFTTGAQYHNTLYLRIKLEWNPSGNKWRSASEKRNIYINITDNSYLTNNNQMINAISQIGRPSGTPINISNSFTCSNDRSILLRHYYTFGPVYSKWSVDIQGTIDHEINGDIWTNKWLNYVSW
jgi:hypothetical protein